MADPAKPRGPTTLIVYGKPPLPALKTKSGVPLGESFELTSDNSSSYEAALKVSVANFMGKDAGKIVGATVVRITNLQDLARIVRESNYDHVIYHGHAVWDGGKPFLNPATRVLIGAADVAEVLKGSKVRHFDILGCASDDFASDVSSLVPGLRVGGLKQRRFDNVTVDLKTKKVQSLRMERQHILHHESKAVR